jgi:hypothetical protein
MTSAARLQSVESTAPQEEATETAVPVARGEDTSWTTAVGIAIIAVVVLRLWDIPLQWAVELVRGDGGEFLLRLGAYTILHVLVGAFRGFGTQQASPVESAGGGELQLTGADIMKRRIL